MYNKILVPIDGSEHSKKALEFACDLSRKFDSEIILLHTVQAPVGEHVMVVGTARVSYNSSRAELEEAGQNTLDSALDYVQSRECRYDEAILSTGSPAKQILECAEQKDVDIIIMGSRGLGDIGGLLLGSVSHKVNHLADCTCITVR